ncbi:MAG TPA: peptide deformylase [Candidatus Rhabdochlamydia sp.]|jgi:peptide deformylase|nr:peptide deformylase [Candidatus Rhabdochlamydia sp.]
MSTYLRYYGDPILRKICRPITVITNEIRQLAQSMIVLMDKHDGVGLAAPQVGHDIRLFVLRNYIDLENYKWKLSEPRVYINPKLSFPRKNQVEEEEGCLSIPKLLYKITRADFVVIEALDLNGNPFKEKVDGYNARVRMHENDHLNGILFIDHLDVKTLKRIKPLLKEIKKKYHLNKDTAAVKRLSLGRRS